MSMPMYCCGCVLTGCVCDCRSALSNAERRLAQADEQQEQLVSALREEHEAELARLLEATAQHTDFVGGGRQQARQQQQQQPPPQPPPQAQAAPYTREDRDGME